MQSSIAALEADHALRSRLSALLGIPAGLPDALEHLVQELREQRLASERRFEATDRRIEELAKQMERQNAGCTHDIGSGISAEPPRFRRAGEAEPAPQAPASPPVSLPRHHEPRGRPRGRL